MKTKILLISLLSVLALTGCGTNESKGKSKYETEDGEKIAEYFQEKMGNLIWSLKIDDVSSSEYTLNAVSFLFKKELKYDDNWKINGIVYCIDLKVDKDVAKDSLKFMDNYSLYFRLANDVTIANSKTDTAQWPFNKWFGGFYTSVNSGLDSVTFKDNKVDSLTFKETEQDVERSTTVVTYMLNAFSEFMQRENLPLTFFK